MTVIVTAVNMSAVQWL